MTWFIFIVVRIVLWEPCLKFALLFDIQYMENVRAFDYRYWCLITGCLLCLGLFSLHETKWELSAQIFATYRTKMAL